jgi:hypothetical protein
MNDAYEVISAFLDDEPFDARALVAALSDPEGREQLIDLIALRHLAQTNGAPMIATQKRRPVLRALVAAAAVVVALVGGYVAGQRHSEEALSSAPAATRVIETSATWQVVPAGRMR